MKKKVLAALLAGTMVLAMGACGQESGTETSGGGEESSSGETDSTETDSEAGETADGGEEVELTVFAAASLTETLTDISELYKEEHPEVSLVFNFDSSGTLKTQIQEGAVCDLFISAGQTSASATAAACHWRLLTIWQRLSRRGRSFWEWETATCL